jgi:hypothetical protein
MTSRNITRNVGFEDTQINVDKGLTFNADVDATTTAKDKVESTGDSRATAGTEAQVAVLDSTIAVGEAAKLTATETGKVIASAETTSGDAHAEAENYGPTGGFIDSSRRLSVGSAERSPRDSEADITIGTSGVISATVSNDATADAKAVGGRSSASADTGEVAGFHNVGIAAGEGASLTAVVSGAIKASAESVGVPLDDRSGNASADAGGRRTSFVGIRSDHGSDSNSISFGTGAAIDAGSSASLASDATTVSGKAEAHTRADLIAGIAVGGDHRLQDAPQAASPGADGSITPGSTPPSQPDKPEDSRGRDGFTISIGKSGSLVASGDTGLLGADAKAVSTNGPAEAKVDIDTIGGLIDRQVIEDRSAHHDAEALSPAVDNVADPAAAPQADLQPQDGRSRHGTVVTIGENGTVTALAVGDSKADASTVTASLDAGRDEDDRSSRGDVVAEINHDHVVGIAIDKLHIGQNGTLYSGAQSTQEATAKAVSAGVDPLARVADGDQVIGILNTDVSTGGNLTVKAVNPDVEAYLSGSASASAVTATKGTRAEAGDDSKVAGIRDGSLAIGENIGTGTGTFKVSVASDLTAKASAISGDVEAKAGSRGAEVVGLQSLPISVGKSGSIRSDAEGSVISDASTKTGDAEASAVQTARGLEDTRIKIGENGSVTATAIQSGQATSSAVSGDAESKVDITAEGIDQRTREIRIGLDGNVTGKATADGDATAKATTGKVEASSSIDANGIDLSRRSAITIGEVGNVSGLADAGKATVTATNTTGRAEANGHYDVAGITGERGATVTAGPKGGDITGTAKGSGDLLADTTTGRADATTKAELFGISHTDLFGGLLGANKLTASADANYSTTSTTVTGNADADGHVNVGALIGNAWGPPHTATLSGDVDAVAKLVNTVTATAVHGSASAHASGDAVGISGYEINIIGSGVISAKVSSDTTTSASTVTV